MLQKERRPLKDCSYTSPPLEELSLFPSLLPHQKICGREGEREGERGGGGEGGGRREGGREDRREGGREDERVGGKEGGREGGDLPVGANPPGVWEKFN